MNEKKLYFENHATWALHLKVCAEHGSLMISLHDDPQIGGLTIPPGQFASFPVNGAVRSCIDTDNKLQFEFSGHNSRPVEFRMGRRTDTQEVVFQFWPLLD
ncbi:hypothetical protein AMJ57_05240 [Parcubacteria bacterium SG8_24]|nr:MAG: hypothetical protein AMJ57_05240 [Parcubacteria bacterium SG8_24]